MDQQNKQILEPMLGNQNQNNSEDGDKYSEDGESTTRKLISSSFLSTVNLQQENTSKRSESMAFARSLVIKPNDCGEQHSHDQAKIENQEDEFFKHVMNDIEEFFRTNKINRQDFVEMKTLIEQEEATGGLAALFGNKDGGISKMEKIESINKLFKYHEQKGNFNIKSQTKYQDKYEIEEILLCELKLYESFTNGKFDDKMKIKAAKLLQQSGMLTKMIQPYKELKDYQIVMQRTKSLKLEGDAINIDDDPELNIEINEANRNKASSMFKVKDHLQTIRDIIMESSLFNLRFGGDTEYLDECELDVELIKNREIVAATLQVVNKSSKVENENEDEDEDEVEDEDIQYLHSSDKPEFCTKDMRGTYTAVKSKTNKNKKNKIVDYVQLTLEDGKNRANLEIEPDQITVSIKFIGNCNPLQTAGKLLAVENITKDKVRDDDCTTINDGKLRTQDSANVMYWDQKLQCSFWQLIMSEDDDSEGCFKIKHRYWGWGAQNKNDLLNNNCFLATDDSLKSDRRDSTTLNLHVNKDESKSLLWKYVGYKDIRLITLDHYVRKIETDLKARSKSMDIFEIFSQLKQSKFDASETIEMSKEFSFTGKRPCYSSTIAPGGRHVMIETTKKPEDTAVKFIMEDHDFKKNINFTGLTDEERLQIGQFTHLGSESKNIYCWSQNMNKVLIMTNEFVVEILDGISRPWQEWMDYIKEQGGEMFTHDELKNIVSAEYAGEPLIHNDGSQWIPIWLDQQKTKKDWTAVGKRNKLIENNFLQSHIIEYGYPKWGDAQRDSHQHTSAVVYNKKFPEKVVTFPGKVFSIRELKKEQLVVTYQCKKDDYITLWNGLENVSGEDQKTREKFMIRNKRLEDPDRDVDVDMDAGYIYTLGKECVVKFSTEGLIYADSTDIEGDVEAVRLSHNKIKLFVLADGINMNIVNAQSMLPLYKFRLNKDKCIDYAISQDDSLIISTHNNFHWNIMRQVDKSSLKYIETFEHIENNRKKQPFQVDFLRDNDFHLTNIYPAPSNMIQQCFYMAQGIRFEDYHRLIMKFQHTNRHHISRDHTVLIQFSKKYVQVFTFDGGKTTIKSYPKDPKLSQHNFLEMPTHPDIKERRYLAPYSETQAGLKKNTTWLYACYNQQFEMIYKIRTDLVQHGFFLGPNHLLCFLKDNKGAKLYDVSEQNAYDEVKANPIKKIDWEQKKKYTKFIINETTYVGGNDNKTKETYEWPSDEYLEKIGKEDINNIRNYQITNIRWIPELQQGSEKDDYLVSWVWTNNLNDKSEVFFTPKKVLQENDIDLSKSQIGRINCKEGGSAQADQFLFFDRDDNQCGQIFQKYQTIRNEELELKIPKDETIVGFKIYKMQSKVQGIQKVCFKTVKFVSDQEYDKWESLREETLKKRDELEQNNQKDEENDFKWEETPYLPDKNDKIDYHLQELKFQGPNSVYGYNIPNYQACNNHLHKTNSFITTFTDELDKKKQYIREYRLNKENQVDIIDHLEITKLPKSKLNQTIDPDSKYFAMLVGSIEKGAEENLLANKLLIWDITNRKEHKDDSSDKGFILIDKIDDPFYDKFLLRSKIETMGFIKIRESENVQTDKKNVNQTYLWLLSGMDDITKLTTLCVYSLRDHKIIFTQTVSGGMTNGDIRLLFDQTNDIIYFVGKEGIKRSTFLWQKQDVKISLQSSIAFNNMDENTPLNQYMIDLGTYLSFPQMGNLLHLFAIMNMGDHLAEALEEKMLIYQTEQNGMTPLMIADENQNEKALAEIYKCYDLNDDMFLTSEDIFILLRQSSDDANFGLDSMFIPGQFLDIVGNMKRGELISTFEDRFSSQEDADKLIFFETTSRFLIFDDEFENVQGLQNEENVPKGVKKVTMDPDPLRLNKVEFMTLQIPCSLRAGSEFSQRLLHEMSICKNKELFRSEATIIVELKWKQLMYYVYLQNSLLLMYVLYFILCKIEVVEGTYTLLVLTILVTIPELQQNYESIRTLLGYNDTSEFGFEDFQNFYELTGYVLQLVYLFLRMSNDAGAQYSKGTISTMNTIDTASCIFIFVRTFFLFRVFSSLRPLIRMIKEVLSGLAPFTTIMCVSGCFFSVQVYLIFDKINDLGESKKRHEYFTCAMDQITIVASGEYSEDNMPITSGGFSLYLLAFYFTVICMMNLLIAIITERYQIVLEQTVPMECIERCVLMNEIEGFVNFIKKFKKKKDVESDMKKEYYYHFARYQLDADQKNAANVEVEGRMRAMMTNVGKIGTFQSKALSSAVKLQTSMQYDIRTKINNILKIFHHFTQKIDFMKNTKRANQANEQ